MGPYLIGEDATDIAAIQQRLREMSYLGWRNWWIEPAFWDIRGKLAGEPVWRLLGGEGRSEGLGSVRVYASTGQVRAPADRIREAQQRHEEGFRTIKLRVHEDEASDVRQVREVARALEGRTTIGVDANQGWRVAAVADAPLWDARRALRFARACADAGVAWLEEPLAMDAYDELAELARRSPVPTAGGELHASGYPELAMMVERGCYRIFQPDALFAGGIDQAMRLARLCRERGLAYTPHTWTNGIGLAVNLQVMAASGFAAEMPFEYPYDPPAWTPEARDAMLEEPFAHDRGRLAIPEAPGLGFAVDRRALRKNARRFFVMDRKRLFFFALRDRGPRAAREIAAARKAAREGGR